MILNGIGEVRWLTPDRLGGNITNPQSLNRYAYVLNNPTTLTDPSGLGPPCAGGPLGGAIAEYREALRLNPNFVEAHRSLAFALWHKGDLNGMIAEEREALRLNPNSAQAHYSLGLALEYMQRPEQALEEYRAAYELNPQGPKYREDYERLTRTTERRRRIREALRLNKLAIWERLYRNAKPERSLD